MTFTASYNRSSSTDFPTISEGSFDNKRTAYKNKQILLLRKQTMASEV